MKSTGAFLAGLVIVVVGLEIVKGSQFSKYAWVYVAIVLLGAALVNRAGLQAFSTQLNAKMKGG